MADATPESRQEYGEVLAQLAELTAAVGELYGLIEQVGAVVRTIHDHLVGEQAGGDADMRATTSK